MSRRRSDGSEPGSLPENGSPWPSRPERPVLVPADHLARPVPEVARALLGCVIESTVNHRPVVGVIVETEAYLGPEDPASHAATRSGVTERNRGMFGTVGRAYVYRSYGVHWCLNIVAHPDEAAGAVLIRGLDLIDGQQHALERRAGRRPLAAGPGRLAQALGLDGSHNGHDLTLAPLRLLRGWSVPDEQVGATPRIGITRAADAPLRYFIAGRPGVSRLPPRR